MKTEEIIEALNQHIEDIRYTRGITNNGHLVLQRLIEPHQSFKVYKRYRAIIWYINSTGKREILGVEITSKVMTGQEDIITTELNTTLLKTLFKWIGSVEYEQVIKG